MTVHNIHDNGYKKVFSNRTFFRQLLETFVNEPWVADLDFSEAETLDKSFVADHYKATESDLIYKLKLLDEEVYIYILMEFQSSVDRYMVVRVAYYTLAFYMDYIANNKKSNDQKPDTKKNEASKAEKLPAVFPLVLYNGRDKWTAPERLADLIETKPTLGDYGVQCRYFKIAENEFGRERLLAIRNLVSTLFLAEAHYDIDLVLEEFSYLFSNETDKQAISLLVNWFRQLMVHGRVPEADYAAVEQEYHSIQEVKAMLIEALAKEREIWRQEVRQEERREGRKEGKLELISQILQRRLGDMPATVEERLRRCTLTQLNRLVNPALDAATWEEFVAAFPQPRS